ncbi:N-terminal acetyltransferase A, auxiliary subunit [Epithele typhae]|uniref:N-terminal acetyltransferase A, auxiliary subunit n=1 Tax=Epithele typhae TaxID=378194 RepID=UPI0020085D23|nr:N-terminal acetyltransferase A, auxiliary subunit [Epithele typhae]KAH9941133.1 N-terminal acetyltransferase A, auxiliary subunit [Epithele typhae]
MPPSLVPKSRVLPSKESVLFKEVLHYYEDRQLKKGLKTADTILKKFPEHGETLCMKGLILTHLDRRDEGLELVKQGIRLDLTSHICWHVFGLIQKGQKNYEEALKSYTQALRFDKDNMNILRDAAHLQTQLRLYDSLVETRHTLLRLRPQMRQNWVALAVAYHLSGNLVEAKNVLEQYERIVKNVPDYDVELSELLLLHVRILEDLAEYTNALSLLDICAKDRTIVDRVAIMESRARILSKLGKDDADQSWQGLIEQNPDCYDYYKGFLLSHGIDVERITEETRGKALQRLEDFSQQFPRTSTPQRLALSIALGEEFKRLIEPYLRSRLEKGIPSLFSDIKFLYESNENREAIEAAAISLLSTLSHPPTEPCPADRDPTMYIWTIYFLAQHHSFLGRHQKAIGLLEEAMTHTPTLPELYMFKARVLKRSGDPFGAAKCMDQARALDLQDRFLNTKSGKYRLRAGLVEEASEVFGLFTKKDAPSPGQDLEDMQSLIYLTEEADAYLRNDNLAMALKRYEAISKVFDAFEDDQFDFHGYCLRKFTINIYTNMIAWEDTLRSHPAYVHAAIEASRILVKVHDNPSLASKPTSGLTGAEKRAKKKAKKAEKKVQEDAKKAANTTANEDKGLDAGPPKDDDPDGSKALQAPEPLERAAKLLKPLAERAKGNIEVWIATYDVAVRRKKYLQAVQALSHAHSLDADSPELHIRMVDFKQHWSSLKEKPAEAAAAAVTSAVHKLLPDELSLDAFNSQYVQRLSSRADAVLAAAKVSKALGAPREEVEAAIVNTTAAEVQISLQTALTAVAFMVEIQSPRADEFRAACAARFPLSTVFLPADELAALRKTVVEKPDPVSQALEEKDEVIS